MFPFFPNSGNNMGKYSQYFPKIGMQEKAQFISHEKPVCRMLGDIFPTLSQKRNFLSHVFPNNGKISHLIPNWEF